MEGSGAVEGYRITYGLSDMVVLSEKPPSSLGVIYPSSIQCIFEDAVTMLDRFSHLTQDTALEDLEESDCLDYWVTSW